MAKRSINWAVGMAALLPVAVMAAQPDAGQILNEQRQLQPRPQERLPQAGEENEVLTAPAPEAIKIRVKAIRFTGAEGLVSDADLQAEVRDAIDREFDYNGLQQLADRITRYLKRLGYPLAYAYLPAQALDNGQLEIAIQSGRIDGDASGITIHADGVRLQQQRIRDTITTAIFGDTQAAAHLKTENLERGLLLLNDMPGIAARASLEKGDTPGSSRIVVNVREEAMLGGNVSIDNYGNRYSGKARASAQLHLNDPAGLGDQANLGLTHAQDLDQATLDYHLPVGSSGLKLGGSLSYLDYSIGKELSVLDANGTAFTAGLDISYPFIRTRNLNLSGALAYQHKRLEDELLGATAHDKRINVVTASLNGNRQDALGNGGITHLALALTRGDLDLSGVAADLAADQATARTNGSYTKATLSLARLQRLTDRLACYGAFNGQLAGDNLDSSEKFILGGPSGVRAYPVGEGSGDSGWVANLELRYDLPVSPAIGELQLVGFVDTGRVELHRNLYAGAITNADNTNSYSLSGAGVGLNYTHTPHFALRGSVASAIGDNPGRSLAGANADGKHDRTQLLLQGVLWF